MVLTPVVVDSWAMLKMKNLLLNPSMIPVVVVDLMKEQMVE